MNIYKVTTFSCGLAISYIAQGSDIVSAIHASGCNLYDIISVELIGADTISDHTGALQSSQSS